MAAARPELVDGEAGDQDDDAAAIGRALQAELNNGRPPRVPSPVSARRIFMEDEAQEFGCASVDGCLPALVAIPLALLVEAMWREYQWFKRRRAVRRGHHNSG